MKYRVNWVEKVGYYAEVEADNIEMARSAILDGEDIDEMGPDGYSEVDELSFSIILICPDCNEPVSLHKNGCGGIK